MTDKLKSLLSNPFLRQNPYRVQQSYFGNNRSYSSSLLAASQANSYGLKADYSNLSANASSSKVGSLNQSHAVERGNNIKKKGNPFFRKNLINHCHEQNFDDIDSVDIGSKSSQFTVPQFLKREQQRQAACGIYQDLSYKAPPTTSSKNYISLEAKHGQDSQNIYSHMVNKISAECKGHLISPRFPSVKVLQNRDLNEKVGVAQAVPLLCYKQSLNHIQSPSSKQHNPSRRESCSQLASPKQKEFNSPQRNESAIRSHKQIAKEVPEDGQPKMITVRGATFFRNIVERAIH